MHAAEKTKGEPVQFVASTCSPSPFLTQVVTLPLRVEGAGLYSTSALPAAGVGLCSCPSLQARCWKWGMEGSISSL